MAYASHYTTRLDPGGTYHIYNRAVGEARLFYTHENHLHFLRKMKEFICPVADVLAYNLLGNHFHLLIEVRPADFFPDPDTACLKVSDAFRRLFQAYALAINKQQKRHGTLFQTPFKRVAVKNEDYYQELVWYIHSNAVHHGLAENFRQWKYSSFHAILEEKSLLLNPEKVLALFGGKRKFLAYHELRNEGIDRRLALED